MIAAASIEIGELGPVVVSISTAEGKFHHTYREFNSDQEAMDHYAALQQESLSVEDGLLYIAKKPDGFTLTMNDAGGFAGVLYGDSEIGVTGTRDQLMAVANHVFSLMK